MAKSIVVRRNPAATTLDPTTARQLRERISNMSVALVPVHTILPNPRNARQHPDKQIRLLAENFRKFGVTQPIVIDESHQIIAGHARLEAAKLLKLEMFPAIKVEYLSPQQKRAVALADNKLPELGSWDLDILGAELKELTIDTGELDFDYSIIGFDTVEIDQLLGGDASLTKLDPDDEVPLPPVDQAPVTIQGDLWICGNHRLLCGNALDNRSYSVVLADHQADLVFTDPPYNVAMAGHVSQRAGVREFAMASGEMSNEQFVDFLRTATDHIASHVANGAVIYLCMDWRHLSELYDATKTNLRAPKNMVVWVKSNAGQGSFYRSQHELIVVYVAGTASPTNNFGLGERGRYRSNVWKYPGFNSFGRDRDAALRLHPTMKPVALVADALRDCSRRGAVVLDPFAGSGTTLVAAERTGRHARLIEIDPTYCDAIVQRWQTLSNVRARLAETDETFAEVAGRRAKAEQAEPEGE